MGRHRPVHTVAAALATGALAVALVGCTAATSSSRSTTAGGGPSTALASLSAASSAGTAGSTTPTSSASTSAASATPTAPRTCLTSQLGAGLGAGADSGAGHTFPYLVLTNRGTTACTVTGYPGVSFVGDGNGTQLGAAATRVAGGVTVTTLTLAPGAAAHAQLDISTAANYDAATCRPKAADGLRVYPPDQTQSLFVATTTYTACQNAAVTLLAVRPLQPGAS